MFTLPAYLIIATSADLWSFLLALQPPYELSSEVSNSAFTLAKKLLLRILISTCLQNFRLPDYSWVIEKLKQVFLGKQLSDSINNYCKAHNKVRNDQLV